MTIAKTYLCWETTWSRNPRPRKEMRLPKDRGKSKHHFSLEWPCGWWWWRPNCLPSCFWYRRTNIRVLLTQIMTTNMMTTTIHFSLCGVPLPTTSACVRSKNVLLRPAKTHNRHPLCVLRWNMTKRFVVAAGLPLGHSVFAQNSAIQQVAPFFWNVQRLPVLLWMMVLLIIAIIYEETKTVMSNAPETGAGRTDSVAMPRMLHTSAHLAFPHMDAVPTNLNGHCVRQTKNAPPAARQHRVKIEKPYQMTNLKYLANISSFRLPPSGTMSHKNIIWFVTRLPIEERSRLEWEGFMYDISCEYDDGHSLIQVFPDWTNRSTEEYAFWLSKADLRARRSRYDDFEMNRFKRKQGDISFSKAASEIATVPWNRQNCPFLLTKAETCRKPWQIDETQKWVMHFHRHRVYYRP